jgi:hypothetical protein
MPTLLERERAPEVVVRVDTSDRGPRVRERRRLSLGSLVTTAAVGAVALVVLLLAGSITGLIDIGNPFGRTTVDRSPPVVLKKLTNLSEFRAARGEFEALVHLEEDVGILPDFIAGESVSFIGVGSVDASVDFSKLTTDAIQIGADNSVTITLSPPKLSDPIVDPGKSHVLDRDRGIVDRVSGIFEDDPTSERELYLSAGKKLAKAARASKLSDRAEQNTEEMLRGLLQKLGFDTVDVVFAQPKADTTGPATS